MSHVRPKENLSLVRQHEEMKDLSEMREQLVLKLKMAYKKINALNAATRKINAVMAILFMKRDKAKSDVESMARKLAAKIFLMQSTFEKEITEIVDQKVKSMEEQVQFVFDEICSLGEACVEAEKVLKIQNEDKLAKDGVQLMEKLKTLLNHIQEGEELGDLEDSMFLQFIPGNLHSKLDCHAFGKIHSSNKDSGISFSLDELEHCDISPVAEGQVNRQTTSCQHDLVGVCRNPEKRKMTECNSVLIQDLVKKSFREEALAQVPDSEKVACPPGFEHESVKTENVKAQVFEYVYRHPNKTWLQSTPLGKETKAQESSSEDSGLEYEKSVMEQSQKAASIPIPNTRKETKNHYSQGTSDRDGNDQLPVISEKWEEEMCEIQELSSAMSVRLQKNIYDRMKLDMDSKQGVAHGSSSEESWDDSFPDVKPPSNQTESASYRSQQNYVRKLFDEHQAPCPTIKQEKNVSKTWEDHDKKTDSKSFENKISWNSQKSLLSKTKDNSKSPDEWWDAPLPEIKKEPNNLHLYESHAVKDREHQQFASSGMVDNWEDLDDSLTVATKVAQIKKEAPDPGTESTGKASDQRSVSPSADLYSWGRNSKEVSPGSEPGNSEIINGTSHEQVLHRNNQSLSSSVLSPEKIECRKDKTPRKGNNIIPGRMKNLLKSYLNSNKDQLSHALDHQKGKVDESESSCSTTAENVESYKSKLLKDNTSVEKLEKPNSQEEKTLTTLGTVPSKSKPPEKAQLRKTVSEEDKFGFIMRNANDFLVAKPSASEVSDCGWLEEPLTTSMNDRQRTPSKTSNMPSPLSASEQQTVTLRDTSNQRKSKRVYTDLAQLVFSGDSWSELSATLVRKVGHLRKGDDDGFFFPIGVGYTSNGDFVVADTGNNRVKIVKNGVFETVIGKDGTSLSRPSAVVLNDRDEIFVKDDYQIFQFDLNGKLLLQIGKKALKRPYGLALTYNGYLVTLDVTRTNHILYLFQQDGTVHCSNIFGPLMNNMAHSKCRFLEVYNEKVIVSDLGLSVMYLGNLFGQVFRCFGYHGTAPGMMREPSGVTVDSAGNWVIADSKNDRIQVFSPNGQYLFPIKLSEPIYRPSDIMLTADRHLLVVNYLTHSVKVYKLG